MHSKGTQSLLSPTNRSKIHLHVEQFSLETIWKLAERLLYNQSYKKDTHGIGLEGKRSDQVSTLGRGLGGKGQLNRQRSSLGCEQFEPYIGHPNPGV